MSRPPDAFRRRSQAGASLLTPHAEGGINVITLTGPDAPSLLDRLFRNPRGRTASAMRPGHLLYGTLVCEDTLLDEVILEREDETTYQINCHGGYLVARRILEVLQKNGVSIGTWKDALRARRELDCVRREAAELIPRASTIAVARTLLDQYRGALSERVCRTIDAVRAGRIESAASLLRRLLDTAPYGRGLTEHPRLVITGRPNVGKSTLANALLRFERVIVHHSPGTTRDVVEETVSIRGLPFTLVDTAGIRHADAEVEREGVRRGLEEMRRADVLLAVFDASEPLHEEDEEILRRPIPARMIPVLNKCDLPSALDAREIKKRLRLDPVAISAKDGTGLDTLEVRIVETAYGKTPPPGSAVVFTRRQEDSLRNALRAVETGDLAGAAAALDEVLRGEDRAGASSGKPPAGR